jgi:hypothetical protein
VYWVLVRMPSRWRPSSTPCAICPISLTRACVSPRSIVSCSTRSSSSSTFSPDYDLNVMTPGQSLGDLSVASSQTAHAGYRRASNRKSSSFKEIRHRRSVQRWRRSTPVSAVAHVEAGLRTGRNDHPFPEEANRRLISCVAQSSLRADGARSGTPDWRGRPRQRSHGDGETRRLTRCTGRFRALTCRLPTTCWRRPAATRFS